MSAPDGTLGRSVRSESGALAADVGSSTTRAYGSAGRAAGGCTCGSVICRNCGLLNWHRWKWERRYGRNNSRALWHRVARKENCMSFKEDSYVKNCYIQAREGDYCFDQNDDGIFAHLDGYAIIPIEEFERLRVKAGEPLLK